MKAVPPKPALARLAEYLESQRKAITQQWLDAVLADAQTEASNLLTHRQLLDRLPNLFDELCRFLRGRDAARLTGAVNDDAREHGHDRWEHGYQIEELLRELHLLRRIVLSTFVTAFADANKDFRRAAETTARNLVEDFFSAAILSSVRQFLTEQQEQIADYAGRLETSNRQLEINNGQLKEIAASRTQLTRTVAHELRNFLHVFSTALLALQKQAPQSDLVEIAQRQTADMGALVDQLLEYSALSRAPSPAVDRFELRPLFDELVESFAPVAHSKRLGLRGEFDPRLSSVFNDRLKVRQIATNLLSNAVKYTESGDVLLTFSFVDQDRWTIAVSDTGIGVAREDQERIFEEWERGAETAGPGTGLGLAIVKELAAQLGGVVRVISKTGSGSRFEVVLPVWLREPPDDQGQTGSKG